MSSLCFQLRLTNIYDFDDNEFLLTGNRLGKAIQKDWPFKIFVHQHMVLGNVNK